MHKDIKIRSLLASFGFSEEELYRISDELDVYKSIPGITMGRYINYIIGNINQDHRSAFLKGIMAGLAIKKTDDGLSAQFPDETDWAIGKEEDPRCGHWIYLYTWNE